MQCGVVGNPIADGFVRAIPVVGNVSKIVVLLHEEPKALEQGKKESLERRISLVRKFENDDFLWTSALMVTSVVMLLLGSVTGGASWVLLIGLIVSCTTFATYGLMSVKNVQAPRVSLIQEVEKTHEAQSRNTWIRVMIYSLPLVGHIAKICDILGSESRELSEDSVRGGSFLKRAAHVRKFDNDDNAWRFSGTITMIFMIVIGIFTGGVGLAFNLSMTGSMLAAHFLILARRYKCRRDLIKEGEAHRINPPPAQLDKGPRLLESS